MLEYESCYWAILKDLAMATVATHDKELHTLGSIPLPMGSKKDLQELGAKMDLKDVNNKVDDIETEGWYKRISRWKPTSPSLLEKAERKILNYVQTKYKGLFANIGEAENQNSKFFSRNKTEEMKIWTLVFNESCDKIPLVVIHGLCASAGLWALNIDALAQDRPVYAIDLLGFGRSSRPKFSNDPAEAEAQHVKAIEAWREVMKIECFILLGHSMGGFLSTAYALKYPERVANLVLADPWGFPKKPDDVKELFPTKSQSQLVFKAITTIGQKVNPMSHIRAVGPYGPTLITKCRPDLAVKFEALNQNGNASLMEYMYHCNAQKPTGEEAFRTMMDFFGWAKNPMCNRLHELKSEVPLTMIYGGSTWLQHISEKELQILRPQGSLIEVNTIPEAGHHVYADNQNLFNSIVNNAGKLADRLFG